MKKKVIIIVGSMILAVALIILSLYWPPVDESEVVGTFKKSDKYQEDNVNKDDIILDSELMKDSNQVNKLIADLVQFGEFSQYLKAVFNQFWLKELEKSKSVPEINSAINQIKDFNNFIDNNNEIIQSTIVKFIDYNFSDKKQIDDMESQLKQLQNYVAQFLARDSLFEFTIRNVDLVIKNRLVKEKEINSLKNLRDKFVIDEFLYGLKMGDTTKVSDAISRELYNPKANLKQLDLANSDRVNCFGQQAVSSYWDNVISILAGSGYTNNQIGAVNNSLSLYNVIGSVNGGMLGRNVGNGADGGNGGFGMGNNGGFYAKDTYFSFNQQNLGMIVNQQKLDIIVMNTQKLNSVDDGFPIIAAALNSNMVKNDAGGNAYAVLLTSDPSSLKVIANASLGLIGNNNPILTNSNFYQVLLPY